MKKFKKRKKGGEQHVWQFSRVGGINRVNLYSGNDLLALEHLDQKLWTALSCPVNGLEIDPQTLKLIDIDNDGRIRIPEIIAAVKWLVASLKDADDIVKGNTALSLSSINDNTDEGKQLLASAQQILTNLGKPDATELTVEDTSDTTTIFANTHFNGDGVITEEAADGDEVIKKLINDIIACIGSSNDLSGTTGITAEHIEEFFKQCEDFSAWHTKAETDAGILPYGDGTAAAFEAFSQVKTKIDDYFLRCRLAMFDSDSTDILNTFNNRYDEIKAKDLSACIDEIATFPLAKVEAEKALPLTSGLNPIWEEAMSHFRELVVQPMLPQKTVLTDTEWKTIIARFEPYSAWLSEKTGAVVEPIGLPAVRKALTGDVRKQLATFIEQDKAFEPHTKNIMLVDKLVRYHRDLYKLLNNYVTFHDFYSSGEKAIFQSGRLYIDQRCCDLCIKVSDMPKHDLLADTSGICLIYCDCTSKKMESQMTIVAALTDGDFDNLDVGRNAIFYDRQGNDWDATIVKVIENPISVRQAFWTPYRRMSKFISKQVENFASSKEKKVEETANANIENRLAQTAPEATPTTDPVPATPPATPFDIGKFVGIFAALSLALGAIGSVVMSLLTGFLNLTWWKMPIAVLCIILCISGPSMILAWLKLRKRNLAPLLDANGWAINARASINIVFGRTLTHLAALPKNAHVNLVDPFKKKRSYRPFIIAVIIALASIAFLLWKYSSVVSEFVNGILF